MGGIQPALTYLPSVLSPSNLSAHCHTLSKVSQCLSLENNLLAR